MGKKDKREKRHSKKDRAQVIDDEGNGDEWVEKPSSSASKAVDNIPSALSLGLTSAPSANQRSDWLGASGSNTFDPRSRLERENFTEGFGDGQAGSGDFFSTLGSQKVKPVKEPPRDTVGSSTIVL